MQNIKKLTNVYKYLPLLIFTVSFLLGIYYLAGIEKKDIFFYHFPVTTDMFTFYNNALNISQAPKLLLPLKTPLYANLFLPVIFIMFGPNIYIVKILQVILGALSNILIYYIAKHTFNRPAAIIAATISVLYARFLIYQGILLSETLAIFLLLMLALMLGKAIKLKTYPLITCTAILFALLILTRPKFLIVAFFLIVWLACIFRQDKKTLVKFMLVITCAVLILVGPQAIKNIAQNSGKLFLLCNWEQASPYINESSAISIQDLEKNVAAAQTKPDIIQAQAYAKAFKFIFCQPQKFFLLIKSKFLLFFAPGENTYDNFPPKYYRIISPLLNYLPFNWGIILPLAFLGMFTAFKHTQDKKLLYVIICGYIVSVFAFQIADRYRLMCEPFFITFAAFALYNLFKKFQIERAAALKLAGLALILELAFNFQALDNKLFVIFHRNGLYYRTQNNLIIRDTTAQIADLRYFTVFKQPSDQAIKHLIIRDDINKIKQAGILIDGIFQNNFNLQIILNDQQVSQTWQMTGICFPFQGTVKFPIPVQYLKYGLNTIKLSTQTPAKLHIYIDTRHDFNRSAFYTIACGVNYQDLGSSSILGNGEYRISIELNY